METPWLAPWNLWEEISSYLSKYSGIWLLLRGTTLWTIWNKRNDVNFNPVRWDVNKVHQTISKDRSNHARIVGEKLKGAKYDWYDDTFCGGEGGRVSNLLYHCLNTRKMTWNTRTHPCWFSKQCSGGLPCLELCGFTRCTSTLFFFQIPMTLYIIWQWNKLASSLYFILFYT